MSEIIELYFEIAYKVIGRILYGKKLSEQASVPNTYKGNRCYYTDHCFYFFNLDYHRNQ